MFAPFLRYPLSYIRRDHRQAALHFSFVTAEVKLTNV